MSYVQEVIKAAHKEAEKKEYNNRVSSFVAIGNPRYKKMYDKLGDIYHDKVTPGKVAEYWYLTAPCYAGFTQWRTRSPWLAEKLTVAKIRKDAEKRGVILPKSDVMLSSILKDNAPTYVLIFPKFMDQPNELSEEVYDILCQEPWVKKILGPGKQTYKKHVESACILHAKDQTLQKVFGAGMALRPCLEYAVRVGPTFEKLQKKGFDKRVAARLSLFLMWTGGEFKYFPGGHSFCQPAALTKEAWIALLEQEWEPKWSQKKKWKDITDNYPRFELDVATSGYKLDGNFVYPNAFQKSTGEGWNKVTKFDIGALKAEYDKKK